MTNRIFEKHSSFHWDRRKYKRYSKGLKVGVEANNSAVDKGRIFSASDISLGGVLLKTEEPLKIGTKVFLRILFPTGKRTVTSGVVWRTIVNGMAVRFDQLCDDVTKEFDGKVGSFRAVLPIDHFEVN